MESEGCALFGGGFLWISGFILIVVIGAVVLAIMVESTDPLGDEENSSLSNMRERYVQDYTGNDPHPEWTHEPVH